NSDVEQKIISYDSKTHKASGVHKKVVSLYNSIINKPLHFRIESHNKTIETTGVLTQLNIQILKLIKNKQIEESCATDILSGFDEVISGFFHLSDVDINVGSRYDLPVNLEGREKEIKKAEAYYVITDLDSNNIQADIGGYAIMSTTELSNDI